MNAIREAAKNLPGHWHKGALHDGKGNHCGVGHLQNSMNISIIHLIESTEFVLMNKTAEEMFPDRMDESMKPFACFNDHLDTTEDEVVSVMEKAAIRFDEIV